MANAQAAVDEVVRRGVTDRERIAIGGHSYGAFMTANLLAHTRLFKAGIARSGAYNRTLTPFGFQAEERNYWQAQDVYQKMAPFITPTGSRIRSCSSTAWTTTTPAPSRSRASACSPR